MTKNEWGAGVLKLRLCGSTDNNIWVETGDNLEDMPTIFNLETNLAQKLDLVDVLLGYHKKYADHAHLLAISLLHVKGVKKCCDNYIDACYKQECGE